MPHRSWIPPTLWIQFFYANGNPEGPVSVDFVVNPSAIPNPISNVALSSNADGSFDLFWIQTTTTSGFPPSNQNSLYEQTYAANGQAWVQAADQARRGWGGGVLGHHSQCQWCRLCLVVTGRPASPIHPGSPPTLCIQFFDANGNPEGPVSVDFVANPQPIPIRFPTLLCRPMRTDRLTCSGSKPPRPPGFRLPIKIPFTSILMPRRLSLG